MKLPNGYYDPIFDTVEANQGHYEGENSDIVIWSAHDLRLRGWKWMWDGGFGLSIISYNTIKHEGHNNIERNSRDVSDYRQISLYG